MLLIIGWRSKIPTTILATCLRKVTVLPLPPKGGLQWGCQGSSQETMGSNVTVLQQWMNVLKVHSNGSNMLVKHCWTQHVWPDWTAQSNILDSVGRCWTMLDEVWLCSNFSSNLVQQFRSHDQKYAIISCLVLKSNIVWWCWIRWNTPTSNTDQTLFNTT